MAVFLLLSKQKRFHNHSLFLKLQNVIYQQKNYYSNFPYLLKAILAQDFDEMEALGIYEVAEEDFALCEFVDVSKNDIQKIVREGIDLMLNS